jgi:hypothetical protein
MGNSTGPRTPKRKARSSRNAAKHWIESGRILPGELKEAAILRSEIAEYFNPQGMIENELIDDLTMNRLIKRRIDIADTREYSKATTEKEMQFVEDIERANLQYWLRAAGRRYWPEREKGERLRATQCIAALAALKRRIGDRGPQPEDVEVLRCIFGDQPTEHAALAVNEFIPIVEKHTVQDGKADPTDDMQRKEDILEALQCEINMQKEREEIENKLEAIEIASDIQEPPGPALHTLLRYRAANTREFNVLLNSLERIRKLRGDGA